MTKHKQTEYVVAAWHCNNWVHYATRDSLIAAKSSAKIAKNKRGFSRTRITRIVKTREIIEEK